VIAVQIRNKNTGAVWEIQEGSPAFKRVKEQPEDYEVIKTPTVTKETKKMKEGP
jgi:hypothetical protein